MEWIKTRMATNFKQSSISAALALAVSASLLKMEPSNYPKEEIAVFGRISVQGAMSRLTLGKCQSKRTGHARIRCFTAAFTCGHRGWHKAKQGTRPMPKR